MWPRPGVRPVRNALERVARESGSVPTPADRMMPSPADAMSAVAAGAEIEELRVKRLAIPVAGIAASTLRSTFGDARGGGRQHEAMDILAARGTAVLASEDGRIAKLFTSAAGGLTIYQFDSSEQYLLLLRASRQLRGRSNRGAMGHTRSDHWLRRDNGQCAAWHAPLTLLDFQAQCRQTLVGGRAN